MGRRYLLQSMGCAARWFSAGNADRTRIERDRRGDACHWNRSTGAARVEQEHRLRFAARAAAGHRRSRGAAYFVFTDFGGFVRPLPMVAARFRSAMKLRGRVLSAARVSKRYHASGNWLVAFET